MDAPIEFVLTKVLPGLGAGALSGGLAVFKWLKGQADRTDAIERKVEKLESMQNTILEMQKTMLQLQGSVNSLRDDVDSKLSKNAASKERERVSLIETRTKHAQEQLAGLADDLETFIKEQGEQWNGMSAKVGEIHGYLKAWQIKAQDSGAGMPPFKKR